MVAADTTQSVSAGFAGLAVAVEATLAVVALLALAGLLSKRLRGPIRAVAGAVEGGELWLAWLIAAVATGGSLYFSEVAGFIPCRLCWFQRIAMYPLVVVLFAAALRRDRRGGALYALALPILGGLVSAYHIYIENHPEAESKGCTIGAPCSTKWIDEFGYVTIPTLAITAFAAIAVLLVLALRRRRGATA